MSVSNQHFQKLRRTDTIYTQKVNTAFTVEIIIYLYLYRHNNKFIYVYIFYILRYYCNSLNSFNFIIICVRAHTHTHTHTHIYRVILSRLIITYSISYCFISFFSNYLYLKLEVKIMQKHWKMKNKVFTLYKKCDDFIKI